MYVIGHSTHMHTGSKLADTIFKYRHVTKLGRDK